MRHIRTTSLFILGACCVLIYVFFLQNPQVDPDTATNKQTASFRISHPRNEGAARSDDMCLPTSKTDWFLPGRCCDPEMPFLEVAQRHVVDKVNQPGKKGFHDYELLYQAYLAPIRCRSDLRLLEVGLGCGMPYGGGHSLTIWMEYFPHAERLVEVEHNGPCLTELEKDWRKSIAPWTITTPDSWTAALKNVFFEEGDQSSAATLRQLGDKHGPFDVVIDDGGHRMSYQVNTLATMWAYIKPGGVYIVEDLQTAYVPGFVDFPITCIDYIFMLQEALHQPKRAEGINLDHYIGFHDVLKSLSSVHCFAEICALLKKISE
jgi:hypothetical protein